MYQGGAFYLATFFGLSFVSLFRDKLTSKYWLILNCLTCFFGFLQLYLSQTFQYNALIEAQLLFGLVVSMNSLVTLHYVMDFCGDAFRLTSAIAGQVFEMSLSVLVPVIFILLSHTASDAFIYVGLTMASIAVLMSFWVTISPSEIFSLPIVWGEQALQSIARFKSKPSPQKISSF